MGLLDEAIREHLELKRRSGADPSEVAREEHEALAPVIPDEHTDPGGDDADPAHEAAAELASGGFVADDGHPGGHEELADLSTVGQDTAELDMQAVMEESADATDAASPVAPIVDGAAQSLYAAEVYAEEPLGWEVPRDRDRDRASAAEDVPGQERLSFE